MHAVLLLASLSINVLGGDPAAREKVKESYERVPECLREPFEVRGELRIYRGSLNAFYFAYEEALDVELERILQGKAESTRSDSATPVIRHYLGVADRLLVDADRLRDEAMIEPAHCASPGELEPFFGNLDRVLLHEIAHSFHRDSLGGGSRLEIEEFLDLRWRGLYEAWAADQVRKRVHEDYRAAQSVVSRTIQRGEEPSQELLQKVCDLQEELAAKYGQMPSRIPGDFHAFTNPDGAEYFAMAIETLVYAPEIFCKTYTREEIAWLKDFLGRCLAQLKKRASCYEAMPSAPIGPARETGTPAGAGKQRD